MAARSARGSGSQRPLGAAGALTRTWDARRPEAGTSPMAAQVRKTPAHGADGAARPFRDDEGLPRPHGVIRSVHRDDTRARDADQQHIDLVIHMRHHTIVGVEDEEIDVEIRALSRPDWSPRGAPVRQDGEIRHARLVIRLHHPAPLYPPLPRPHGPHGSREMALP